ncbi:MAG: portal protein [Paracoccaceae bacterium]
MDAKTIIERRNAAKAERQRLEGLYDDCFRLTMPARKRFHNINPVDNAEDIFDETGANALAEFVSRMQAGLMPPFTEFVKLDASLSVDPRDAAAVNRDLDDINKFVFEEIWDSNFAQETAESLYDMAVSTGVLLFEEGTGDNAFHHRAIPITDVYLERGANDMVGGVFRTQKVQAKNLPYRYPKMDDKNAYSTMSDIHHSSDKELNIIEYTYRDFSEKDVCHYHFVICEDHKEILQTQKLVGEGSNPFIAFRWATASGETWGRGPLLNAMGAIRTTNLMVEMILENAAMSIVGIYQTDNEGTVNADNISLLPGTIINREIGTRGLEPIGGSTGNFNMQDVVLGDQRLNIKKALYNDMLSDPNKTPATATEVAERMADLAHRTSAGFARVFYEFIQPYMRRALYILEKRGDIQLPVVNGRAIQIRAISPLAQAQAGRDVQKFMSDFNLRASVYGPQIASQMYNTQEVHNWLQEKMGLETKLYKTADEVMQTLQAQQEMLQQMQMQEQQAQQGAM